MPSPRPVGWRDHVVGFVLAAAFVAVLVKTAPGLGYARDEGFYFSASSSYAAWFESLVQNWRAAVERPAVDAAWAQNHEHPALAKSVFALSWTLLYKKWHLFAHEGTSFRFGGMLFAGGALWLLYVWGARARGRLAGIVAAALFALMPRIFYHAHLDCFDVPIATMWALCAYAYWRSLERGGAVWPILTGIAFGLALDTKHNAWFLPFAFVAHAVLSRGMGLVRDARVGVVRVPAALVAMALLGPPVFVALWPWLWNDTLPRFLGYVQFHTGHEYYNMIFLGQNYWKPPMPRGYAWLMTAATVPGITLLLFFVGLGARAWARLGWLVSRAAPRPARDPASTDLLWLLGVAVAYAPWLSTKTPIFGGTKHWMTAYPFLCLFAGAGFDAVVRTLRDAVRERWPAAARLRVTEVGLAATVLLAPALETAHSHPWGLTNYTPLVGGAPGAATMGLNRGFWGFTTGAVLGWLNRHVPPGGAVFLHDTAWDSWEMLHRDGRLRADIQGAWIPHGGAFGLYHHEEHMEGVEYQLWVVDETVAPAHVGTYDGVPVVWIYAKKGAVVP